MKKKWLIISLSIVLVLIVTIVTLSFTLFTVQEISVNFRTSTTAEYSNEDIIASSGLKKGKNIFFLKKQPAINNIEKAHPYLEVVNIETSFPSKLTIHLRERESFYAIQSQEGYLIVDHSLKVLERVESFEMNRTSPILFTISSQDESVSSAQVGDFLNFKLLSAFYDAMLLNGRSRPESLSLVKEISYFESENEIFHNSELGLKLTLFSGREVYIHNGAYALAYKLAKFFAVESRLHQLAPDLSDEIIKNSEIHINNYIGSDISEKECYFYLVFNGEKVTI